MPTLDADLLCSSRVGSDITDGVSLSFAFNKGWMGGGVVKSDLKISNTKQKTLVYSYPKNEDKMFLFWFGI